LGSYYLLAPKAVGQNTKLAEAYLSESISRDPLFADAYVRLAQVYAIKGEVQKRNQYLNKALEIDPQNELALDTKSGRCKFICASE